jgi:hypothetical protein
VLDQDVGSATLHIVQVQKLNTFDVGQEDHRAGKVHFVELYCLTTRSAYLQRHQVNNKKNEPNHSYEMRKGML